MKTMVRAIGIDDAPFHFRDRDVLVIGSLVRAPNYLEGILSTRVKVDGNEATDKLIKVINDSRFSQQAKAIFVDGAALGGFNIVDLRSLWGSTGIPAISVSREEPNMDSIQDALKQHLPDWEDRLRKIDMGDIHKISTEHNPIYIRIEGIDLEEAKRLLQLFTIRGRLPEPIRISHIIASGVVRGESRGRA